MNNEKKLNFNPFITLITLAVIYFIICYVFYPNIIENNCKNYLISHKSEIQKDSSYYGGYEIKKVTDSYYTDVTIRMYEGNYMYEHIDSQDSSFTVIFWGDRDSWMWRWRLDKSFSVDIPYDRYKGKDVSKDVELYKILKNIK